MDLGQGFLVEGDLNAVGDVQADELRDRSAGIGDEGVAERRISSYALGDERLDLRTGGNGHADLLRIRGILPTRVWPVAGPWPGSFG